MKKKNKNFDTTNSGCRKTKNSKNMIWRELIQRGRKDVGKKFSEVKRNKNKGKKNFLKELGNPSR